VQQEHVELITEPISEITTTGIRTTDGIERPADVVIYGTGFTASQFLTPMRLLGRGGVELNEQWDGDARAYLGMTVPEFPNLFMLYGPNTNLVINGSIIVMVECQVRYIVEALGQLLRTGHHAMSCRSDVHDAYNEEIDAGNKEMVWGVTDVPSWYRNRRGRIAQNWPFGLLDYWERTRHPDLADYELT
jgi:4-hydroxyacetophenone monooxygenase